MGHRTLSVMLVLRALGLQSSAYDELRDDDNPFVEGAFLIILIGVGTGLLNMVGQLLAWASTPRLEDIKALVLQNLMTYFQTQPWWEAASHSQGFLSSFQRSYDLGWQIIPVLLGAPTPVGAAMNILLWPAVGLIGWLVYGSLAFTIARILRGTGSLNQTLGATALAFSPLLLRGLGIVPFFAIGGVVNTWQLIGRYQALRSAHRLTWGRAVWATLLPFAIYMLFWIMAAGVAGALLSARLAGR